MKDLQNSELDNLLTVLTRLNEREDISLLLDDLFTIREIQEITQRLEVARMLSEGKSYATIIKKTCASATTVARVSKCLSYGSGGYARALEALKEKEAYV
ncbi:MAG: hypothetical protein LBG81_03965 [Coriobacteriaceae bacterium]|jgi:TrpR-related protein YerC/YecD|nr:hypothetical protein [Coriobacteriaceae bacterium]